MSNHYHENREKQMNEKIHGLAQFQHENGPYPVSGTMNTEHMPKPEAVQHSSIELLAYRIYREKGGTALDNWLEAERILRQNH